AAHYLERGAVDGILPLEHEPDIPVVFQGENARAVLDLNELVQRLGAARQHDEILPQLYEVALMNPSAGHPPDQIAHSGSSIAGDQRPSENTKGAGSEPAPSQTELLVRI